MKLRKKKDLKLTLGEIATCVNGKVKGVQSLTVIDLSPSDEYQKDTLTFYTKNNIKRLRDLIARQNISSVMLPNDLIELDLPDTCSYIFVDNVMSAIVILLDIFYPKVDYKPEISSKADIHPTVEISEGVSVGAFSSIGEEVKIGKDTIIFPHVTIYPGAVIGANCIIHSQAVIREHCTVGSHAVIQNGAVIGADGFGYIPDKEKVIAHVPQIGRVHIKSFAEVGANSCVDRGTIGDTVIGEHTKVDNLVQIGHNVKIGQASMLCGQVGVAGSVSIGNQVVLGGKVGVADHIEIPDKSRVAGGSTVTKKLRESGDYIGVPAMPAQKYRKQLYYFRRLEELFKKERSSQ